MSRRSAANASQPSNTWNSRFVAALRPLPVTAQDGAAPPPPRFAQGRRTVLLPPVPTQRGRWRRSRAEGAQGQPTPSREAKCVARSGNIGAQSTHSPSAEGALALFPLHPDPLPAPPARAANPDALWQIVPRPVRAQHDGETSPAPCDAVDIAGGFAVLKDLVARPAAPSSPPTASPASRPRSSCRRAPETTGRTPGARARSSSAGPGPRRARISAWPSTPDTAEARTSSISTSTACGRIFATSSRRGRPRSGRPGRRSTWIWRVIATGSGAWTAGPARGQSLCSAGAGSPGPRRYGPRDPGCDRGDLPGRQARLHPPERSRDLLAGDIGHGEDLLDPSCRVLAAG